MDITYPEHFPHLPFLLSYKLSLKERGRKKKLLMSLN